MSSNYNYPFVIDNAYFCLNDVIGDGQEADGNRSQPTPVTDSVSDSSHEAAGPTCSSMYSEPGEPTCSSMDSEPGEPTCSSMDSEPGKPTCSSVDSEPGERAQPSVNPTTDLKNDVGYFIDATKSASEVERVVHLMSDGQKYHLLKHHDKPSESYKFPTQYLGGATNLSSYDGLKNVVGGWSTVANSMVHSAFPVPCLPKRGRTWLPW